MPQAVVTGPECTKALEARNLQPTQVGVFLAKPNNRPRL